MVLRPELTRTNPSPRSVILFKAVSVMGRALKKPPLCAQNPTRCGAATFAMALAWVARERAVRTQRTMWVADGDHGRTSPSTPGDQPVTLAWHDFVLMLGPSI